MRKNLFKTSSINSAEFSLVSNGPETNAEQEERAIKKKETSLVGRKSQEQVIDSRNRKRKGEQRGGEAKNEYKMERKQERNQEEKKE